MRKGFLLKTGGIILLLPLIIYLLFYIFQDSILFYPQPLTEERLDDIDKNYEDVQEIILEMKDGTTVHGWLAESKTESPSPLLIYYGGNAEEVSYLIEQANKLENRSVLLMNYRGYGNSEGSPGEAEMFSDALEIYDYISGKETIDDNRIAVMGRSMGTGVAVYVAEQRNPEKIVLVSPYDSLTYVARDRYPFVPVSILLNHQFDNISRGESISTPLLTLIGSEDTIIPPEHSVRLGEAWNGPTKQIIYKGKGHNDIHLAPDYWQSIIDFIEN
ncbi:alpha/beta hydrolase [Evansella clarkii]|uniref:alpha/beta hydrolase n=1 Tax=Evansella clarkii TaxID=79879 RepID=UPI000B453A0E|nr:alpha/beta hydrolase [Evansella clarkii]